MKKYLLAGAMAAVLLALTPAANADPIIHFGQTSGTNTVTATNAGGGTSLSGTNIAVLIDQIQNIVTPPAISAFLDITATNTSGAVLTPVSGGTLVTQRFSGTFSITSGMNDTGINYLSGSFSDGALTALGAVQIAIAAPTASFTSDVITSLDVPRAIGFNLTAVLPPVTAVACGNASCADTGNTIGAFTASVSGNAAAAVPEPASLAIFGSALVGLGLLGRRRKRGSKTGTV